MVKSLSSAVVTDHYYSSSLSNGYDIYRQFRLGHDMHILDATRYIAVVVNDVRTANVMFKRLGDEHICLLATRNIPAGDELLVYASKNAVTNNQCSRPLSISS